MYGGGDGCIRVARTRVHRISRYKPACARAQYNHKGRTVHPSPPSLLSSPPRSTPLPLQHHHQHDRRAFVLASFSRRWPPVCVLAASIFFWTLTPIPVVAVVAVVTIMVVRTNSERNDMQSSNGGTMFRLQCL